MLDSRKLSDDVAAVLPLMALVMQRWTALARGEDPGASNPEQPGADQFEWPSEPPGAEDRYSEMLLIEGPVRRNRQRKRSTRLGSDGHDPRIRADYEKRQRRLRPKKSVKCRKVHKPAGSKAGAPRADIRREALLFLTRIYRVVKKQRPTISQRSPTEFQSFAEASFAEIGLKVPFMSGADFASLLDTDNKEKFNRKAVDQAVLGGTIFHSDPIMRSKSVRDALRGGDPKAVKKAVQAELGAQRRRIRARNIKREAADRAARPQAYAEHARALHHDSEIRAKYLRHISEGGSKEERAELKAALDAALEHRRRTEQRLKRGVA
jgi:hypothetical protein